MNDVETLTQTQASFESGSSGVPRARRPKIVQACRECRSRKVRCDGIKPTCSACRRRRKPRSPCLYPADLIARASEKYVAQLEQRLRKLEGGHHHDLLTPLTERQPGNQQTEQMLLTSGTADEEQHSVLPEGPDAMGNFIAADATHPETGSSAADFMTQIKSAIAAKIFTSQRLPPLVANKDLPDPWTDPQASLLGRSTTELFVLPSRRTADQMLKIYWDQVHILYPFLLPDRFTSAVQCLFTGENTATSEVPTYCIMNLAFAIVCQVTKKESPLEKAAAADIYYRRATFLLQTSVIGRCSTALLQALLLMGQYLQSTEWPRRCWVVVGHAIRTAKALGLHIADMTERLPVQDRELMRRLWHGCIFFDRIVSMTLGRPMVISQADARAVPLPAENNDCSLSSRIDSYDSQPEQTISKLSFYIQTLKLADILEQILSQMYSGNSTTCDPNRISVQRIADLDLNTILRIDNNFAKWHDQLPRELIAHKGTPSHANRPFFSQARVLRLRYLQNRILLFRPVLSFLLAPKTRAFALSKTNAQEPAHNYLPLATALPFAYECVRCALETITIIHEQRNWSTSTEKTTNNSADTTTAPLPSWWFEVFFIYTAATALIPARAYGYLRGDISQDSLTLTWQRSLEVLRELTALSPSAVSCIAALQVLDDELVFEDAGVDGQGAATLREQGDAADGEAEGRGELVTGTQIAASTTDVDADGQQQQYMHTNTNDLDSMLQMQDFSWLDTLPVDVLGGDDADMPDMWRDLW
jgi:Fungal specific transcription factor domain/Fungal Zn(2)-Cys(6) binuclear cluster domain